MISKAKKFLAVAASAIMLSGTSLLGISSAKASGLPANYASTPNKDQEEMLDVSGAHQEPDWIDDSAFIQSQEQNWNQGAYHLDYSAAQTYSPEQTYTNSRPLRISENSPQVIGKLTSRTFYQDSYQGPYDMGSFKFVLVQDPKQNQDFRTVVFPSETGLNPQDIQWQLQSWFSQHNYQSIQLQELPTQTYVVKENPAQVIVTARVKPASYDIIKIEQPVNTVSQEITYNCHTN